MAIVETQKTSPLQVDDTHLADAAERVSDAANALRERGIVDGSGHRIRHDLPEDMNEDAERDFGG